MGRPLKKIDAVELKKLAMMQCTLVEIAAFFEVDIKTITNRFSKEIAIGREQGKISLRRLQWKHAQDSARMAIWLGKQYLDQHDKVIVDDGKLINEMLEFKDVPQNGDGQHRFEKFISHAN